MKNIFLITLCFMTISACKKEEEKPTSPTLAYKSISATEVQSYQNEVKVVFSYEDFQGDLGTQDPDEMTLFVKDARLDQADQYHVPPMTPEMQELHIKGDYEVTLSNLFLLGNGASETTTFSIQIRDRAGNLSNTIQTDVVTITP